MSALRAIVNNLFLENFNTTFMINEKKKKKVKTLIFFYKIFFKINY